jgi:hypothetical protein
MVVAIDSVVNAFASLISTNAVRDFQLEANSASAPSRAHERAQHRRVLQPDGRTVVGALGSCRSSSTGRAAGTMRVLIGGTQVGSATYSTALDSAATLALMTNRNQNAYVDGAVARSS